MELKGIGRRSAEYILLRGLGRLNVFPGDDIAAAKNLRQWLGVERAPFGYDEIRVVLKIKGGGFSYRRKMELSRSTWATASR
jgi:DNA-3-methyladenine glycosylase II